MQSATHRLCLAAFTQDIDAGRAGSWDGAQTCTMAEGWCCWTEPGSVRVGTWCGSVVTCYYMLLHVTTSYSLIWSTRSLTTAVSGFSVFCPFSSLQVVHLCLSCLVDKIFVRWFCVDAHIKKPVAVTCVSIREHRRKFGLQAATEVAPTSLPASAFET